MITADAAAVAQMRACQAAQRRDPDLVPYCGPEQILRRFQAGEVVTGHDCLTDLSPWIIEAIHHRASERLHWMVRNL